VGKPKQKPANIPEIHDGFTEVKNFTNPGELVTVGVSSMCYDHIPGFGGGDHFMIERGNMCLVVAIDDPWVFVIAPNGSTGWIHALDFDTAYAGL